MAAPRFIADQQHATIEAFRHVTGSAGFSQTGAGLKDATAIAARTRLVLV